MYRVNWLRDNWAAVHEKLKTVDEQLASQMLQAMEGHPGTPFGLSSLDLEVMCLCRIVDRFQRVAVEFVGEIFKSKPETLIAAISEKVDAADVLMSIRPAESWPSEVIVIRRRLLDMRQFVPRCPRHRRLFTEGSTYGYVVNECGS